MTAFAHEKSQKLRSYNQFLPSTFEERGATVPFTTPLLSHSRVRKNYRDQLELCVPRFTDAEGQYIVPWPAVRDLTQMTMHDRLLYDHVVANNVQTPHDMRMAALSVARSGFAGPEVAEAAAKALDKDEDAKALNHVVLILRVLQETAQGVAADLRDLTTSNGQERVRAALYDIADKLSLPAEILDKRLSELALMTYAVGASWSPVEGRLRGTLKRLAEYRDSLRHWAADRVNDAAEKALFAAEVADLTLGTSATLLATLDAGLKSPYAIVVNWGSSKTKVEGLANRLSWLLDGWDTIVEWWLASAEEADQIAVAEQMMPVLPLLPRAELDAVKTERAGDLVEKGRRWVRLNQDWLTGEFDLDTIKRIETLKAKAL